MKTLTKKELRFRFYREGCNILRKARIPFLVAGTFALEKYTGIRRSTKDLDIFLSRKDIDRGLRAFAKAGYRAELKFSHWLGKVYHHNDKDFIDLIFSSGNGVCEVDSEWFDHAVAGTVFDTPVEFPAPEEMIWQKAFVMERERFDGADVAHLLRSQWRDLDWPRLLRHFNDHWRVLLTHLILFGYIYPGERTKIPNWVYQNLLDRLQQEFRDRPVEEPVCQGTFLSRSQYRTDIECWGYRDPRPSSTMTLNEAECWTAAGGESESAD